MRNLLRPETAATIEQARKIASRKCCALCLGDISPIWAGDGYQLECATHGIMYPHMLISRRKAEQAQSDRLAATMDLGAEAHRGKSETQLLEEMGF